MEIYRATSGLCCTRCRNMISLWNSCNTRWSCTWCTRGRTVWRRPSSTIWLLALTHVAVISAQLCSTRKRHSPSIAKRYAHRRLFEITLLSHACNSSLVTITRRRRRAASVWDIWRNRQSRFRNEWMRPNRADPSLSYFPCRYQSF